MKVILTRDVPKVGQDGDIVVVANGYARNYLFPRQLAISAHGPAMKLHTQRVQREIDKTVQQLSTAQQNAEKLQGKQFQILAKANPKSNRLFGAVTEADVAEVIQSSIGVTVDKRKISLIDPIKVTGIFELTARLHSEVVAPFTIEVVTPDQLEARERARQLTEEKAAREAALAAQPTPTVETVAPEPAPVETPSAAEETPTAEA